MFVVYRRDPVCLKVVNLFLEKCHEVHLIASSFQGQTISYHRSYTTPFLQRQDLDENID